MKNAVPIKQWYSMMILLTLNSFNGVINQTNNENNHISFRIIMKLVL